MTLSDGLNAPDYALVFNRAIIRDLLNESDITLAREIAYNLRISSGA